jgi:NAD(P)-dependent dehydrogenase (short-subunit alcohol dehydrogenase family)
VYDLSGRVAFVTGAGRNIGAEIARTLAKAGAAVACVATTRENLERVVAEIKTSGGKAVALTGDISDRAAMERAVSAAESAFGTVDILVNNAAITINKSLFEISLEEWERVMEVNLTGVFICSQLAAQRMIAAEKPGVIVNIGSTSGHRGKSGTIAYTAAKGGVLNLTRAMAIELAPHGIRVVSVSPTASGEPTRAAGENEQKEVPMAIRARKIPLGRLGKAQDHAQAVLFMVSDAASFITGEDLRVDGGALATWGPKRTP